MDQTKTNTGRQGPFHNEIFNVAAAADSAGSHAAQPTPPTTTSTISSSTSSTLSSPSQPPATMPTNLIYILQNWRDYVTVSFHSSIPNMQALIDSTVPQGTQFPLSLAMAAAGSMPSNPAEPLSERQKQSGCQPYIRALLSFLLEKPHLITSYFMGRTSEIQNIMENVAVEEAAKQFESSQQYLAFVRQQTMNQATAASLQSTAAPGSTGNVSNATTVASNNTILLMPRTSAQPRGVPDLPDYLIQELRKFNVVFKPMEAQKEETKTEPIEEMAQLRVGTASALAGGTTGLSCPQNGSGNTLPALSGRYESRYGSMTPGPSTSQQVPTTALPKSSSTVKKAGRKGK